jgi:hypothetical protein
VREVVLGEQVDEEARADLLRQARVLGRPLVVGLEVAAPAVGHELVREPLLGLGQMAVQQAGHDRLELGDEGGGVHRFGGHGP